MGKWERVLNSPSYLRTKAPCCFTHSCTVRAGTSPVLPVRRWSMGLIEPRIRSLETPPLSRLPKPRPIGSMHGPSNVDGRRLRWVSGSDSAYQADYKCQGDSDDMQ